jgi:hypothetical protein
MKESACNLALTSGRHPTGRKCSLEEIRGDYGRAFKGGYDFVSEYPSYSSPAATKMRNAASVRSANMPGECSTFTTPRRIGF